jgi:hypothetical protein
VTECIGNRASALQFWKIDMTREFHKKQVMVFLEGESYGDNWLEDVGDAWTLKAASPLTRSTSYKFTLIEAAH